MSVESTVDAVMSRKRRPAHAASSNRARAACSTTNTRRVSPGGAVTYVGRSNVPTWRAHGGRRGRRDGAEHGEAQDERGGGPAHGPRRSTVTRARGSGPRRASPSGADAPAAGRRPRGPRRGRDLLEDLVGHGLLLIAVAARRARTGTARRRTVTFGNCRRRQLRTCDEPWIATGTIPRPTRAPAGRSRRAPRRSAGARTPPSQYIATQPPSSRTVSRRDERLLVGEVRAGRGTRRRAVDQLHRRRRAATSP